MDNNEWSYMIQFLIKIYEIKDKNEQMLLIQKEIDSEKEHLEYLPIKDNTFFDNDISFLKQIKREFIFYLIHQGNSLLSNIPINNIRYLLSVIVKTILDNEETKKLITKNTLKHVLFFILNSLDYSTKDDKINLIFLIKCIKTLMNSSSEIETLILKNTIVKDFILQGKQKYYLIKCNQLLVEIQNTLSLIHSSSNFEHQKKYSSLSQVLIKYENIIKKCMEIEITEDNLVRNIVNLQKYCTEILLFGDQCGLSTFQLPIFIIDRLIHVEYAFIELTNESYSVIHEWYVGYEDFSNELDNYLKDKDFQLLIYNIMNSSVMKDYYSSNPILLLSGSNQDKITKVEMTDNLIMSYKNFITDLNSETSRHFFFNNTFYIMEMPNNIKGFTNRFMKIVINCNGLEFSQKDNKKSLKDTGDVSILIKSI